MNIKATAVTKDGTTLTSVTVDISIMQAMIEERLMEKLEKQVEMGAVNDLKMWETDGRKIKIS